MSIRQRRSMGSFGKGQNAGTVRIAILLSVAAFFLFLIFTLGVQQTKAADCDCGFCHGDNHHGDNWTGCSGCHDSPPQTGTHLVHYNSAPLGMLRYGDTGITSAADAYKFGCGTCHPLDRINHNNGIVDVELYNASAPAGSLKAKSPSNASYTGGANVTTYASKVAGGRSLTYSDGTCNNVYCHSGYAVMSSGPVGMPLTTADDPSLFPPGYKLNWGYIMDETCSNVTYAPYTVTTGRVYKTTPAWGTSGAFTTCKECHEFPLTTFAPAVKAGVGDSHQWVDDTFGYNWRHAYNMGGDGPIPCRTCHNSTVTQAGTTYWTQENGAWITAYNPVPLASRIMHVNGTPDIAFDTVNNMQYWSGTVNLAGASYDAATKTCSDVGCHYNPYGPVTGFQKKVKWGAPNRMDEGVSGQECDVCHRMGYLSETCTTPAP